MGRQTGTIKWFNDPKGFGFITTDGGEEKRRQLFIRTHNETLSFARWNQSLTHSPSSVGAWATSQPKSQINVAVG
jgi:hypothetical protein